MSALFLGGHMDTFTAVELPVRRTRRRHEASFKASVVAACCQPGMSLSAVSLANGSRKQALAKVHDLLMSPAPVQAAVTADPASDGAATTTSPRTHPFVCHHCGQPLTFLLTLARGQAIRAPPPCAGGP